MSQGPSSPPAPTTDRVAAAADNTTFSAGKRWRGRLGIAVGVLLALYCFVAVNAISFRHPWRLDFTEDSSHTLSGETRAVLGLVSQDIDVILPFYIERDNQQHIAHARALEKAAGLLREYSEAQPRVRLIGELNVLTDAAKWKFYCEEYDLHPTHYNRMIFLMGKSRGSFRQTVMPNDLAVFERSEDSALGPPVMRSFRGEIAMTEAISRLVHQKRRRVYFTTGHGELVPRPERGQAGMAALVHDLEASGFEVSAEPLDFSRRQRVPEDCELLLIAGAEEDFDLDEIDGIQEYLLRGGRLFVALGSARTRLDGLLEDWGIEVRPGSVRLRATATGARFESSWIQARSFNPSHPVTAPFTQLGDAFAIRLLAPRPLAGTASPRRLVGERILSAVADSKGLEQYHVVGGPSWEGDASSREFDLAIAASQERLLNPPQGWQALETRVVALGSASLLRDVQESGMVRGSFRDGSHRDFFMNCVHWLVGQEELATQGGGRQLLERRIRSSDSIQSFLFFSSILIFPGVFLSFGAFVYFLRRA